MRGIADVEDTNPFCTKMNTVQLGRDFSTLPAVWTRGPFKPLQELARVADNAVGNDTLPLKRYRYRALGLTPPDKVKVVILGMDPYPKAGRADGLAFSYSGDGTIPQALSKIFKRLPATNRQTTGSLEGWARQGVLLLNVALSVRPDAPGSHLAHWKWFTTELIRLLALHKHETVFVLWGEPAKSVATNAGVPKSRCLCYSHPCASTVRSPTQHFRNFSFAEVNEKAGIEVDWVGSLNDGDVNQHGRSA